MNRSRRREEAEWVASHCPPRYLGGYERFMESLLFLTELLTDHELPQHPTSNVQLPTSNVQAKERDYCRWALKVERWTLSVWFIERCNLHVCTRVGAMDRDCSTSSGPALRDGTTFSPAGAAEKAFAGRFMGSLPKRRVARKTRLRRHCQ